MRKCILIASPRRNFLVLTHLFKEILFLQGIDLCRLGLLLSSLLLQFARKGLLPVALPPLGPQQSYPMERIPL